MKIQSAPATSLQDIAAGNKAPASAAQQHSTPVTEASEKDQVSLSSQLKAGGERFLAGSIQGTKAAAVPAMVAATAGLIMSDPQMAGLALLAGPSVGLIGAGAAGLVVGGTANALGASKGTAAFSGAAAGAAAGWALHNLGSPKERLVTAGIGAVIGGASGFAGAGAGSLPIKDTQLNRAIGGAVGMIGTAGVALALSGGRDVGAWGMLLSVGGGVAGYAAVKALGEK